METVNSGFCKIHTIIKLIEGACWRCERNAKAILNGVCKEHINIELVDEKCHRCEDKKIKNKEKAAAKGTCENHSKVKLVEGKCPSCKNNSLKRKFTASAKGVCRNHTNISILSSKCMLCEEYWDKRKVEAASRGTCYKHLEEKLISGLCQICNETYEKSKIIALENGNCPWHTKLKLIDGRCQPCDDKYEKRKTDAEANNTCPTHIGVFLINDKCLECKKNYDEAKAIAEVSGTCPRHLNDLLVDGYCLICRKTKEDRKGKVLLEGRCFKHPKMTLIEDTCTACLEDYQKLKRKAQASGTCINHPEVKAVSGMQCYDCWCSRTAYNALGSRDFKDIIKESFKNNFCIFTGVILYPGDDILSATMDHSIPLSRGGEKKLENCQWTTRRVNHSKSDRTTLEYLEEIKKIYVYTKAHPTISALTEISQAFRQSNENGKCHRKGCKFLAEIGVYCKNHWFKRISSLHFGMWDYAGQLEALFKSQGGICPYTGTKLVLCGSNMLTTASIDHITPSSRGGRNEVSNMQYVTQRINIIKQDMSHEEFLKFCEYIVVKFNLR